MNMKSLKYDGISETRTDEKTVVSSFHQIYSVALSALLLRSTEEMDAVEVGGSDITFSSWPANASSELGCNG